MSWTGNTLCTSFKVELLTKQHDFSVAGDVFKMALYDEDATLNFSTTDYTTANEIVQAGYTAGGLALTNVAPTSAGKVAYTTFANAVWSAQLTARGALIYNSTLGTNAVLVLDFGGNRSSTGGVFTVTMPSADELNAIIRIT
jgi:hypothetical protein